MIVILKKVFMGFYAGRCEMDHSALYKLNRLGGRQEF